MCEMMYSNALFVCLVFICTRGFALHHPRAHPEDISPYIIVLKSSTTVYSAVVGQPSHVDIKFVGLAEGCSYTTQVQLVRHNDGAALLLQEHPLQVPPGQTTSIVKVQCPPLLTTDAHVLHILLLDSFPDLNVDESFIAMATKNVVPVEDTRASSKDSADTCDSGGQGRVNIDGILYDQQQQFDIAAAGTTAVSDSLYDDQHPPECNANQSLAFCDGEAFEFTGMEVDLFEREYSFGPSAQMLGVIHVGAHTGQEAPW